MDAEAVLRSMGHDGLIDYAAFCKLMEKLEMEVGVGSGRACGERAPRKESVQRGALVNKQGLMEFIHQKLEKPL